MIEIGDKILHHHIDPKQRVSTHKIVEIIHIENLSKYHPHHAILNDLPIDGKKIHYIKVDGLTGWMTMGNDTFQELEKTGHYIGTNSDYYLKYLPKRSTILKRILQ